MKVNLVDIQLANRKSSEEPAAMNGQLTQEQMKSKLEKYEYDNHFLMGKLDEAEEREEELKKQNEILAGQLRDALSPNSIMIKKCEHSAEFWKNIELNCCKKTGPFGTDAIKEMIKTGKMTMHDTEPSCYEQNLLMIAAGRGAYELVQFLINNVCAISSV